jgi:transcriptional regulator with PAS, ATPase and Fis domain
MKSFKVLFIDDDFVLCQKKLELFLNTEIKLFNEEQNSSIELNLKCLEPVVNVSDVKFKDENEKVEFKCDALVRDLQNYDVVFLDLHWEKTIRINNTNIKGGFYFLKQIADSAESLKTPILMYTGEKLEDVFYDKDDADKIFSLDCWRGILGKNDETKQEPEQQMMGDKAKKLLRECLERIHKSDEKIISIKSENEEISSFIRRIGSRQLNVLLTGESGVGKEWTARHIHEEYKKYRSGNCPFIPVNCADASEELFTGDLFGWKDKSSAAAFADHDGYIKKAHGGTLFLDEISELSLPLQAALLRVVQEKKVLPEGATEHEACDFRLICATNRNLEERVKEKKFRADLYFRICNHTLKIPPLHERKNVEKTKIIKDVFNEIITRYPNKQNVRMKQDFIKTLSGKKFSANVRAIQAIISVCLATIDNSKQEIEFDDIPKNLLTESIQEELKD